MSVFFGIADGLHGQAIFAAPDAIPFQVAPAAHIVGAVVAIFQIGVLEGRIRHRVVTRLDLPGAWFRYMFGLVVAAPHRRRAYRRI